jgi:simple sugar transport system permease protein
VGYLIEIISLAIKLLHSAIRAGSPLLIGTLGEIYSEQSGILNLGLEGTMLMGAVSAFAAAQITGNPWIGVTAALIVGGLTGLVHGFICISLKANQYVSGLAITLLGQGLSSLIGLSFIGLRGVSLKPVLFGFDPLVYIFLLLVPVLWFILFKSIYGIMIRSVGENPAAADALGINVDRVRYLCTVFGSALAALGGAYLSIVYIPSWTQNMTSGRGWIILALTIFASWDPRGALIGAWVFGGIEALQYRLQPLGISPSLLATLPFVFTIVTLMVGSMEKIKIIRNVPASLGKPYRRGER